MNAPEHQPILDVATKTGFLLLQDRPPHEVVIGAVVVAPPGTRRRRGFTPDDYKQLATAGLRQGDDELSRRADRRRGTTRLVTETRVFATDRTALRRFTPYWRVIFPGSAILRITWLRAIKARAERASVDGTWMRRCALLVIASCCAPSRRHAHPAPFSYLDLRLNAGGVTGTLVVHDLDAAHDLGITQADSLLDPAVAARHRDALVALLSPRITLQFDGRPVDDRLGRDRRRAGASKRATRVHRRGRAAGALGDPRLRVSVRSDSSDLHQPLRRRRADAAGDPRCVAADASSITPARRRAASR